MSAEDDLILGAIAGVPRLVMQLHRGEVTPAELYRRASVARMASAVRPGRIEAT